jgi:hypothetical protein
MCHFNIHPAGSAKELSARELSEMCEKMAMSADGMCVRERERERARAGGGREREC